jgi:hypothetical protein
MTPDDWELYHSTNIENFRLPTWFGLLPASILMSRLERFSRLRNDLALQHLSVAVVTHIMCFINVDIASRGRYNVEIACVIAGFNDRLY